jgi:hypothetical protein
MGPEGGTTMASKHVAADKSKSKSKTKRRPAEATAARSANYLAFVAAGLMGTGQGDGVSATNAVVRVRVMQRFRKRRP